MTDKERSDSAVLHVKQKRRELISHFVGSVKPVVTPISVFMAGSPGAGKTEFSKRLIEEIMGGYDKIVRIDPDEIRLWLPQYITGKAELFQEAVSTAVNKIHDHVKSKSISFLLDGTFSNIDQAKLNVQQSIDKGRPVKIQYVIQPPIVAWKVTQDREIVEGRNIKKEDFVNHFVAARDSVAAVKKEFGSKVEIDLIERDVVKNTYKVLFNIGNLDKYLPRKYSEDDIEKLI